MQKTTRGKLNKNLLNYFAGFFDGEGTIVISKYKNYRSKSQNELYVLCVRVTGKDKEIIKMFYDYFTPDNKFLTYKYREKFEAYQWGLAGPKAMEWLKMIKPYLVLKKERAEHAIKFQEYKSKKCSKLGGHITDEHRNKQNEFYLKAKEFNKKNIDCSRND